MPKYNQPFNRPMRWLMRDSLCNYQLPGGSSSALAGVLQRTTCYSRLVVFWMGISLQHIIALCIFGTHPDSYRPARQACEAAYSALNGPMRTKCPDIITNSIGPYEGLYAKYYRLLWANSSLPASYSLFKMRGKSK